MRRVKNGTPSTHPLTGRELRELRRHQRESAKSPFVFVSERGAPLSAPGVASSFEPLHCPLRELVDDFDAVHSASQLGEHRRLIAEASADLENYVVRLELEHVRHHRDHERL